MTPLFQAIARLRDTLSETALESVWKRGIASTVDYAKALTALSGIVVGFYLLRWVLNHNLGAVIHFDYGFKNWGSDSLLITFMIALVPAFAAVFISRIMSFLLVGVLGFNLSQLLANFRNAVSATRKTIFERAISLVVSGVTFSAWLEPGLRLIACLVLALVSGSLSYLLYGKLDALWGFEFSQDHAPSLSRLVEPASELFWLAFTTFFIGAALAGTATEAIVQYIKLRKLGRVRHRRILRRFRPFQANLEHTLRVAHLSDLHITKGPLTPLFEDKNVQSPNPMLSDLILNSNEALQEADLILVTGDITDTGQPEEWGFFQKTFDKVKGKTVLVPGNHDVNIFPHESTSLATRVLQRESEPYESRRLRMLTYLMMASEYQPEALVLWGKRLRKLGQVTKGIDRLLKNDSLEEVDELWRNCFPQVVFLPDKNVAVFVLDSIGNSTAILSNAFGYIGGSQLAKLSELLERFSSRSAIFALHHHVALPVAPRLSAAKARGMVLQDSSGFLRLLLERTRHSAIFHGHHHDAYLFNALERYHVVSAPSTSLGDAKRESEPPLFYDYDVGIAHGACAGISAYRANVWCPARRAFIRQNSPISQTVPIMK